MSNVLTEGPAYQHSRHDPMECIAAEMVGKVKWRQWRKWKVVIGDQTPLLMMKDACAGCKMAALVY
jgi:hypothetical protein